MQAVQVCGDIIMHTGRGPTLYHPDTAQLRLDATQLYDDLRWVNPEHDDAFFRIMMQAYWLRERLFRIFDGLRILEEDINIRHFHDLSILMKRVRRDLETERHAGL